MPIYFKNMADTARRLGDGLVEPGGIGSIPDTAKPGKVEWFQTQQWELVAADAVISDEPEAEPFYESAAEEVGVIEPKRGPGRPRKK